MKIRVNMAALSAIVMMAAHTALAGQQIYVNNQTGKDSNPGITADAAVATLAKGVALLQPGGTLIIANTGREYREPLLLRGSLGTPAEPLVIEGNGAVISGLVRIPAEQWKVDASGFYHYPVKPMAPNLHPILLQNGIPLTKRPDVNSCQPGEYAWTGNGIYFLPPADKKMDELVLDATLIDSGIGIQNSSHIICRNLISERHPNDGFNIHGDCRNIVLEHVTARDNGDDGCSIHEDGDVTVRDGLFIRNSFGIADINASRSTYIGMHVVQNRIGARFAGGVHQLIDVKMQDNSECQVQILPGRPAVGYTASDAQSLIYDSLCVMKNVLMTGKSDFAVVARQKSRVQIINCLIMDAGIGIALDSTSMCDLLLSVVANCQQAELQTGGAMLTSDYNIFYPGRFVWSGSTLDLEAHRTKSSVDTHSLSVAPQFKDGSLMLQNAPFEQVKSPVGLTAEYPRKH